MNTIQGITLAFELQTTAHISQEKFSEHVVVFILFSVENVVRKKCNLSL